MSDDDQPEFIVCVDTDPVIVRINGKANYLNCSPVNDFFDHILSEEPRSFLVDFSKCLGMDSTFLGVLAGVATKTMRQHPPGKVILANLNSQNKQLIRGLGLHHLPTVQIEDGMEVSADAESHQRRIEGLDTSKEASPEMILEAHERLMKLNRANERRFQDVVKFLRREAEKGDRGVAE